ncbi:MFS transporter [Candidatus Villigracilis affinis]|uniref:MFS transporter n=1 Tax=Candidatus Villigracilis affinis TaxID=3140682 RepID=UPI001B585BD6|nr:MFS transporter [Anaerolineales bacterium]MBP8048049.1 MFS transporter [Anaerolineales bacterium]
MKLELKSRFNDLLFARLYYFTFMGGWGFVLPFINLFYVSIGFNGKQIGFISSTSAIVGMLVSPLWVSEVKKRPQARNILQAALILGGIGYYAIGLQNLFPLIIIIVFLHALAASGIAPLSDSMAVTVSQESGSGYGSVRVWGSLGWIVTVLSSGWLTARYGFIAAFIGVAVMWLIAASLIFFIQPRFFSSRQISTQPKPNLRVALQYIWQDKVLRGFAFALIVIGFFNNGVLQFENVFLSELGATKQIISVAGILSAVVEIPFMIYSDKIVQRVGAHRLLLVALSMTIFMRLSVLTLPSIITIMVVRFIGGVAFSFYTISFIKLISSRTQPTETGTVLAIFSVTLAGLVNIVASPVSGAIFDVIGARWLYALSSVGYVIGIACLWLTRPTDS